MPRKWQPAGRCARVNGLGREPWFAESGHRVFENSPTPGETSLRALPAERGWGPSVTFVLQTDPLFERPSARSRKVGHARSPTMGNAHSPRVMVVYLPSSFRSMPGRQHPPTERTAGRPTRSGSVPDGDDPGAIQGPTIPIKTSTTPPIF